MAFLGRMNSQGELIEREVLLGSPTKCQRLPQMSPLEGGMDYEPDTETLRTYVKTYDSDCSTLRCHTPISGLESSGSSTVRFVASSASSTELSSVAETYTSTLRCASPISSGALSSAPETETETETLRYAPQEEDSMHSSASSVNNLVEQCEIRAGAQLDKGSTISMCSWDPMYDDMKPNEEEEGDEEYEDEEAEGEEEESQSYSMPTEIDSTSYIVPPLELQSVSGSLSYEEVMKLERSSSEAYENWLTAKERQRQYKQHTERLAREQMEQENLRRQELAAQRFQQWCAQKARQAAKNDAKKDQGFYKDEINGLDTIRCVHAWELRKLKEEERRRELLQRQALKKQQQHQQRKLKAQHAWEQWMKNVDQRPKPVPLNQGLESLRGTVSKIFINPNHWVTE
ncbi:coiled-coil domain-containing protein 34 [Scaptodrosophila lebanonensis]|uniref:Coiled-coil domain-containing protein 34 n=1 Tax=Drosophila lebanonensis TaxID=7225 RepID=A0A6J2U0F6_DROLE|nr:coiled-coil domain-containing protein 34 [Scaptodrosophila lebanonensis]